MRILFDQGTPAPLRRSLTSHVVSTAYEQGWSTVTNGDLIRLAEQQGYELLLTTDTNLRYQQNLQDRTIAILVLSTTSWPRIKAAADQVVDVVAALAPGDYSELRIPRAAHREQQNRPAPAGLALNGLDGQPPPAPDQPQSPDQWPPPGRGTQPWLAAAPPRAG